MTILSHDVLCQRSDHRAQLLESYRLIIDTASAIQYETTPARPPPPPETLERMFQAAAYGAQALDAASKRVAPEPPRPPVDRPPEDAERDASGGRQVRDVDSSCCDVSADMNTLFARLSPRAAG